MFDAIHYRYKHQTDDFLIEALTTKAYDFKEKERQAIRDILVNRDVQVHLLPEPTLIAPLKFPNEHPKKDVPMFRAVLPEHEDEFTQRAETLFHERGLDPEDEEVKKRYDLDKNTGFSWERSAPKFGGGVILAYILFRIILFLIRMNS